MRKIEVDVAVIGAGTAGMGAYRAALKHTKKAVLIENGPFGTTCARVGCMPSKLLIAAAESAHTIGEASRFGLHVQGPVQINGKEVMARVRAERDRFVGFVLESVNGFDSSSIIKGTARFTSPKTLVVGKHIEVTAKAFVIATGSQPFIPPAFHNLGERLVINDNLFDWQDLPSSLAVIGPGVVGLELGQALHRLGVRVTILGRSGRIGLLSDPVIQEYATRIFQQELDIHLNSQISLIEKTSQGAKLKFTGADKTEREEVYDAVLMATGRIPRIKDLQLENAGIKLDNQGFPVFDKFTLQCGDKPVFMAGDANKQHPLLHEAADDGKIAGDGAALFPENFGRQRRAPLSVMFSDPQIAIVGKGFKQLKNENYEVGMVSFEDQGRSRVMLKNKGILRVYAEKETGLFLGAEMFGPAAEHIGHLLAWSRQQKLTVTRMLEMPFYHPVIEEGLRTALRDVNSKLHLGPTPVKRCMDCGPGA